MYLLYNMSLSQQPNYFWNLIQLPLKERGSQSQCCTFEPPGTQKAMGCSWNGISQSTQICTKLMDKYALLYNGYAFIHDRKTTTLQQPEHLTTIESWWPWGIILSGFRTLQTQSLWHLSTMSQWHPKADLQHDDDHMGVAVIRFQAQSISWVSSGLHQ